MKEADKIVVLDTGSTDNTVKLLKELNVDVYEKKYDSQWAKENMKRIISCYGNYSEEVADEQQI